MSPYGPQKKTQCTLPAGAVVWNPDNEEYYQITGERQNLYWLTPIKMDRGDRYLIADAGTFKLTYDRQTKLFELGHCAEE